MKCPYCGASRFRLSHLRFSDFVCLLAFRYPVRCRLCRERTYVSFATALRLRAESRTHRAAAIEQHEARIRQEAADRHAAPDPALIQNNAPEANKRSLHH